MAKRKMEPGKIVTKVVALLLALLMIVGVGGTLLYYLIAL